MTKEADRAQTQSPLGDCAAAFLLLSRIPVTWYRFPEDQPPDFISSLWAFPVVGLVIGAITGGCLVLAEFLMLPSLVAAAAGLLVLALLSGAMHEDGLADMADGFGGGRDVESKIRIMHDSRIGSYGVMALILGSTARLGLLMACLDTFDGLHLAMFIAFIQAASRFQPVVQLSAFSISPHASLAHLTGQPGAVRLVVAALIWLVPLAWLVGIGTSLLMAVPVIAVSLWIGSLAMRQVDGLTGDVMGATTIIGEIALLSCWVSIVQLVPA